jgi:hypothetical protein
MKKLTIYLIVALIYNISSVGICQIIYDSKYLENMYESLPLDCRYVPSEHLLSYTHALETRKIITSRSVTINFIVNENKIEDLGISVFDSSSRSLFQSSFIYRFIERKVLELLLINNDNTLIDKIQENDINLLMNGNSIVNIKMLQRAYSIIYDKSGFKLTRDSLRYELRWVSSSKDSVFISFPASNTLIRAKDKKELDEEIAEQLNTFKYYPADVEKPLVTYIEKSNLIPHADIYCLIGKTFLIKAINTNSYYNISENGFSRLVFERKYLAESLSNLIQFPTLNDKINVNIYHKIYGDQELHYSIKLCKLITYFEKECTLYTGIEEKTNEGIKAIIIMYNSDLNIIHLMTIDTKADDLFSENKTISVTLHTNIPADNIQNLFGDYIPQKGQYKLLLK